MENELLIRRIEALEEWREQRERRQITTPLDETSINVLNEYFMRIFSSINYDAGAGGNPFVRFIGKQAGKEFVLDQNNYIRFIVNVTSNVFTIEQASFDDDQQVQFTGNGTVPAPLVADTTYFVRDSTGTTFKVAATAGGAAIDITDAGTGDNYIYFF